MMILSMIWNLMTLGHLHLNIRKTMMMRHTSYRMYTTNLRLTHLTNTWVYNEAINKDTSVICLVEELCLAGLETSIDAITIPDVTRQSIL